MTLTDSDLQEEYGSTNLRLLGYIKHMDAYTIAQGLAKSVFSYLFADGKITIAAGLRLLADGVPWVAARVADWLYNNGHYEWSHRVRVLNRYIFNTMKVTAYVLSAWRSFETVSRLEIDNNTMDFIE